jgi:hypothetical protein
MFVRLGQRVEIVKTIGARDVLPARIWTFGFCKKGSTEISSALGLPPSDQVAKKNFPEFAALCEKWLPLLKNPDLLQVATAAPVSAAVPVGAR